MARSKSKKTGGPHTAITNVDEASIVEDTYGNYRIRAGRLSGNFVARAFPKSIGGSKGLMAEASGSSESEAIAALKTLLDQRKAQRIAARRWEHRSEISVPSVDEFIEALQQANLSEPQLSMLKAQAFSDGHSLTMGRLMHAAGYRSESTANKVYARAGALIADHLGVDLSASETQDKNDTRRVISYLESAETDTPALLVMHEEMREAIIAAM